MIRILSLCAALLLAAPAARAEGFDRRAFDQWVSARAGDGKPVYWYSVGTVRAYPSGALLARIEGFDATRSFWPDRAKPLAHQYNRKIYVYRDAETNAIIRKHNGQKVAPIAYPYQFITCALNGDRVETMVEQGAGARVQRIGPGASMSARRLGETLVVTAQVIWTFPFPVRIGASMRLKTTIFLFSPGGAGWSNINYPGCDMATCPHGPAPAKASCT
jgi:hypothetical protein